MNIFSQLTRRNQHSTANIAQVQLWHFAASIEEAVNPKLRTIPFAVVQGAQASGRIVDANDLARSLGVRLGQSLAAAQKRAPSLAIREWSPQRIAGFSGAFRKLAKHWGRVLHIAPDGQSAMLAIPAANALERAAIFLHIQQACWKELECNVIVGVGTTPVFALLAAQSCAEPGFRYLDRWEESALRTIPVASIPHIGRRTAQALVHLGVPTVWHFLQLNPDAILETGGPTLLRIYRQYVPDAQLLPAQMPGPAFSRSLLPSFHTLRAGSVT